MRRSVRSSLVAAAIGALAALALVVFGAAAKVSGSGVQVLALFFALLCPPWELFWAGIGEPHNVRLWVLLSGAVVAANALLYIPAGLAHSATAHLKAWVRFLVVAVVGVGSLGLGHLYFIP